MALIKCPECGRENVSDMAVACPNCGFPIKKYFESVKKKQEESAEEAIEERITDISKLPEGQQLSEAREIAREYDDYGGYNVLLAYCYNHRQYKRGIEIGTEAIKKYPRVPIIRYNMALCYSGLVKSGEILYARKTVELMRSCMDDFFSPNCYLGFISDPSIYLNYPSSYKNVNNAELFYKKAYRYVLTNELDSTYSDSLLSSVYNNIALIYHHKRDDIIALVYQVLAYRYNTQDQTIVQNLNNYGNAVKKLNPAKYNAILYLQKGDNPDNWEQNNSVEGHFIKCPTCGSTNVTRISLGARASDVLKWGVFSRKKDKLFHCNNCKYEW